ncbi:hypothetical protein VNO77_20205 [Canavalia gladiata]|uniref:Uncharacterized protein n=1 Tax=Canavalia gladiata TaxID=3824 RepID=A0AAN9LT11_CANGL
MLLSDAHNLDKGYIRNEASLKEIKSAAYKTASPCQLLYVQIGEQVSPYHCYWYYGHVNPFLAANEWRIWISVSKLHLNLTAGAEFPFVHMYEVEESGKAEELQRDQRKEISQAKRTLFT